MSIFVWNCLFGLNKKIQYVQFAIFNEKNIWLHMQYTAYIYPWVYLTRKSNANIHVQHVEFAFMLSLRSTKCVHRLSERCVCWATLYTHTQAYVRVTSAEHGEYVNTTSTETSALFHFEQWTWKFASDLRVGYTHGYTAFEVKYLLIECFRP